MDNVDKLVGKLTEVMDKAGGEAARIWPQMVALYSYQCMLWVVCGGLLLLGAGVALVVAFWAYRRCSHDSMGFDFICVVGAALAIILPVIGIGMIVDNLPGATYPEPALVQNLLRRSMR